MKTMKTSDINSQMDDSKGLLKNMYDEHGEDGDEDKDVELQKTKINFNQKLKFVLHWALMISVHFEIFWFIPIRGNRKLYHGKPYCDPVDKV